MKEILLTNNEMVREKFSSAYSLEFIDGEMKSVLLEARRLIHMGHRLLTHPLSGSAKPNETPFKSILITGQKGELDDTSLRIIENALVTVDKFPVKYSYIPPEVIEDFKTIDCSLISGALIK